MNLRDLKSIVREEIDRIIEKKGPGTVRPPQVTDKILPDHDTDSKVYGASTLTAGIDVDGKPNPPKKLGSRDIYNNPPTYKEPKTLSEGIVYHINNRLTLDENVFRPGTREFFSLFNEARDLWREGKYEATMEEYELFQGDIGKWAMFEGRMVPLDFPMWDEGLNESFADHYGDQHGEWIELSHDDLAASPEVYDEVFSIIDQSYAYVGGHANYKSAGDVRTSDTAVFALIDVDDDREVDAVRMNKGTSFGLKSIASATDGSQDAKSKLKDRIGKELTSRGYYAEVSDAAAAVALKKGAPPISSERVVRTILGGKDIEWHGENPDGKFPGTYGWYTRVIGGDPHTKIMVGLPNIGNLDEAKYKGRTVKLGKAGASKSGGRAHVFVRDPKTGNIKKVSFGSSMPDAMGSGPKAKARRKSFGERHGCADKTDKTKGGYWACRTTKLFGRNIPGWW
jgi:hypothetical protein